MQMFAGEMLRYFKQQSNLNLDISNPTKEMDSQNGTFPTVTLSV